MTRSRSRRGAGNAACALTTSSKYSDFDAGALSIVSARPSKPALSVKQETLSLVAREIERIKNDAKLKGLIQE